MPSRSVTWTCRPAWSVRAAAWSSWRRWLPRAAGTWPGPAPGGCCAPPAKASPASDPPPALPDQTIGLPPGGWVDGYLSAVEWRPVRGQFGEPGPATVWTRLRYPLVPDEETGPLERVLAVADSGNGLSGELDITKWLFINPELTVHLHREAAGEWVCLDARTEISAGGAGLATSVLSDTTGRLGVGAQSLLISPRKPAPSPAGSAGT